jgi:signal transduction histidine kinase
VGAILSRDDGKRSEPTEDERVSTLSPRLRAAYKLEAIGSLASGLAHEINNPIQSIMNYAQLIRRRATDAGVQECADEIAHEAHRVATIVRNLQAFVHDREEAPTPVRIADVVERACNLFGAALHKENIVIEQRYGEDIPDVTCRPRAIEQIIVNLLMGARDALNDRHPKGGKDKRVIIEARAYELADKSGRSVRLSVEDFGTPIADRDIKRVFEPFAALPGRDQGAGLGLAVSYDIARANGCSLSVEREERARSTRFVLDLPSG